MIWLLLVYTVALLIATGLAIWVNHSVANYGKQRDEDDS